MIESNFQNGLNYVEIYVEMAKHKIVLYKNKLSTHCTYVQSVTLAIVVYLEAYCRPCRRVASIVWDDGTTLCYENTAAHPVLYKLLWLG